MSQNRGMSAKQYRELEKRKPRKDLVEQVKKPTMQKVDDFLYENVVEPAHKLGETTGKVGSGIAAIGSAAADLATPDDELDVAMGAAGPFVKLLRKGKKALKGLDDMDRLLQKDKDVNTYLKRVAEEAKRSKTDKEFAERMDLKRIHTTRPGVGAATSKRTSELKEDAVYAIEQNVVEEFPELFDELSDVSGVSSKRLKLEWSKFVDEYKDDHIDAISVNGFLDHLSQFDQFDEMEIFEAGQDAVKKLSKRLETK